MWTPLPQSALFKPQYKTTIFCKPQINIKVLVHNGPSSAMMGHVLFGHTMVSPHLLLVRNARWTLRRLQSLLFIYIAFINIVYVCTATKWSKENGVKHVVGCYT